MARIARITAEHIPYHITQRGNARQQVFFEDRDPILHLDLLHRSCQQANLQVSTRLSGVPTTIGHAGNKCSKPA